MTRCRWLMLVLTALSGAVLCALPESEAQMKYCPKSINVQTIHTQFQKTQMFQSQRSLAMQAQTARLAMQTKQLSMIQKQAKTVPVPAMKAPTQLTTVAKQVTSTRQVVTNTLTPKAITTTQARAIVPKGPGLVPVAPKTITTTRTTTALVPAKTVRTITEIERSLKTTAKQITPINQTVKTTQPVRLNTTAKQISQQATTLNMKAKEITQTARTVTGHDTKTIVTVNFNCAQCHRSTPTTTPIVRQPVNPVIRLPSAVKPPQPPVVVSLPRQPVLPVPIVQPRLPQPLPVIVKAPRQPVLPVPIVQPRVPQPIFPVIQPRPIDLTVLVRRPEPLPVTNAVGPPRDVPMLTIAKGKQDPKDVEVPVQTGKVLPQEMLQVPIPASAVKSEGEVTLLLGMEEPGQRRTTGTGSEESGGTKKQTAARPLSLDELVAPRLPSLPASVLQLTPRPAAPVVIQEDLLPGAILDPNALAGELGDPHRARGPASRLGGAQALPQSALQAPPLPPGVPGPG